MKKMNFELLIQVTQNEPCHKHELKEEIMSLFKYFLMLQALQLVPIVFNSTMDQRPFFIQILF